MEASAFPNDIQDYGCWGHILSNADSENSFAVGAVEGFIDNAAFAARNMTRTSCTWFIFAFDPSTGRNIWFRQYVEWSIDRCTMGPIAIDGVTQTIYTNMRMVINENNIDSINFLVYDYTGARLMNTSCTDKSAGSWVEVFDMSVNSELRIGVRSFRCKELITEIFSLDQYPTRVKVSSRKSTTMTATRNNRLLINGQMQDEQIWQSPYFHIGAGTIGFFLLVAIFIKCHRKSFRRTKKTEPIGGVSVISTTTDDQVNSSVYYASSSTYSTDSATSVPSEQGLSIPGYLEINYTRDLRVRNEISSGAFGTVHIADALSNNLRSHGNLVVVKLIKKTQLSQHDIQTFRQEISLMEYFKDNKNIAKIIGFSERPFCIVMKFYPLGNLKSFLSKVEVLQLNKALYFAEDIARGLMALHEKGVCHLDLKPANILLESSATGEVFCVLTDFGISQVVNVEILKVQLFDAVQINGLSAAYAAPERFRAFHDLLSVADVKEQIMTWDIYSFGILLSDFLLKRKSRK